MQRPNKNATEPKSKFGYPKIVTENAKASNTKGQKRQRIIGFPSTDQKLVVPWRQAIEVSFELFSEIGIRHGLIVAGFHQPFVHIVPHVVVAETAERSRRRRALSHAFNEIHSSLTHSLRLFVQLIRQRKRCRMEQKARESVGK